MADRNIYLVRHGESEGNVKRIFQDSASNLTDVGKFQAKYVAHRFEHIDVDKILASDAKRAKQTSQIIKKHIGVPVEYEKLLRERKHPSIVQNKKRRDPKVRKILKKVIQNYQNPQYYHSDEENMTDLIKRSQGLLKSLKKRKEENLLCVTHGTFIKVIVGAVLFEEDFSPKECLDIIQKTWPSNTGITHLILHRGKFYLKTFNDIAHLG